jgi:flagellar biosynthesis/type III secretory pathway protein FliH
MGLKYELEKIDDLDETTQQLYEKGDDGKYRLKVEGMPFKPDPEAEKYKEEAERYKKKHAEAEKHRKDQEKAAREAAEKAAKNSGDLEALEKSWQEKLDNSLAEKDQELTKYQQMVSQMTVGSTATSLAAELFGEDAETLKYLVEKRLSYEVKDGEPQVRVLDENGQLSAKTIDDLKEEFKNSKRLAKFVVGSRASGPGSPGGKPGSGTKKFNEYTGAELKALRADNPQEYEKIKKEYYGE